MKYFTILLVVIFSTSSVYTQWQLQNSGTSENLNDVTIAPFTNGNHLFVAGDNGTILRTTDKGNTWNSKNSGTTNNLNAIAFCEDQTGIAVGDGVLCLTADGGESWFSQNINKNAISVTAYFSVWYGCSILIGCDDGTILYSGDFGNSWLDTVLTPEPIIATGMIDYVLQIAFSFFATNSFTGESNLPIWELSNWNIYNNPISAQDSIRCGELNSYYQYLVGTRGSSQSEILLLRKYYLWDTLWVPTYSSIASSFIPEDIAIYYDYNLFICGSDGKIFASVDDGSNWTEQITGVNYKLNAIIFRDTTGYSVGENGTILFTSNGGGINDVSEMIQPTVVHLYQNYPNPFNPSTFIQYEIDSRQLVQLRIFDVLGNEIAILVNKEQPAGSYKVEFNPALTNLNYSSGIYFYQLSTAGEGGESLQTKKMLYLK